MLNRMIALSLAASALSGSPASGQVQAGPHSGYRHYYFKEARSLTLDERRVAVRGGPTEVRGAVERAVRGALDGPAPVQLGEMAVAGWWLVDLPPALRNDAAIQGLVDSLAADETITFASPVFVGLTGGPVIVTARLLVGFTHESPAPAREAVLTPLGQVTDADWAGMRAVYRVGASSRNGSKSSSRRTHWRNGPTSSSPNPTCCSTGGPR